MPFIPVIIKDYYKILEVKPTATTADIKKSYRKLAMKYHPDKNQDNAATAFIFGEITEAYTVLSNPETRVKYHSTRYSNAGAPPREWTIEDILHSLAALEKNVSLSDPFRIDSDYIYLALLQILTADAAITLAKNATPTNQQQLFTRAIACCQPLALPQTVHITAILQPFTGNNKTLQEALNHLLSEARRKQWWGRYTPVIAAAAAILLCLAVFFSFKL